MSNKSTSKTVSIIAGGIAGLSLIYLLAASMGWTNSFYSWDVRQSAGVWKVLTFIGLGVVSAISYLAITERIGLNKAAVVGVGLLLALSLMASASFKGTAGDIKQRVSYLNNTGQVVDTALLFNCYEEFYQFNKNPELKQYVIEYGELPGRNTWNYFIRSGKSPKSAAPRADEFDFQWHTDAYEMDLRNKNCR